MRVHPFPFRTRQLSSPVPTILVWRRTGKIGQRQHKSSREILGSFFTAFNPCAEALDAGHGGIKFIYDAPKRRSNGFGNAGQRQPELVFLTVRVHPFPFRTRQLSSPVPTILVWRRTGKIGQRQYKEERQAERPVFFLFKAPLFKGGGASQREAGGIKLKVSTHLSYA